MRERVIVLDSVKDKLAPVAHRVYDRTDVFGLQQLLELLITSHELIDVIPKYIKVIHNLFYFNCLQSKCTFAECVIVYVVIIVQKVVYSISEYIYIFVMGLGRETAYLFQELLIPAALHDVHPAALYARGNHTQPDLLAVVRRGRFLDIERGYFL